MTLPTHFLLGTLRWRGFKHSFHEMCQLAPMLPVRITESEYQSILEAHFLISRSMSERWFTQCAFEFEWLQKSGASYVTYFENEYPEYFKRLAEPPAILTWWGKIAHSEEAFISVVGSRKPSLDTLKWMDTHLDVFLQNYKAIVVSGGARGIDQKAHSIAIRNDLPTICVVPSGLNRLYPAMLEHWKRAVLESGGAIASSLSPFSQMEKRFFVERNRYIACWSKMTFILEAKRKSGTMLTANWVTELERELAVLPCAPNQCGLGGLDLIANGATIIRDHFDLGLAFERGRVKSLPACAESEKQQLRIKHSESTLQ